MRLLVPHIHVCCRCQRYILCYTRGLTDVTADLEKLIQLWVVILEFVALLHFCAQISLHHIGLRIFKRNKRTGTDHFACVLVCVRVQGLCTPWDNWARWRSWWSSWCWCRRCRRCC